MEFNKDLRDQQFSRLGSKLYISVDLITTEEVSCFMIVHEILNYLHKLKLEVKIFELLASSTLPRL